MADPDSGLWAEADASKQAQWQRATLWRVGDLEALCCGLVPRLRRLDSAKLNAAREQIEDAIAVGDIRPDDLRPGTRIMGDGPGFRPANVVEWAARMFPHDFPFKPSDFGLSDEPLFVGVDPVDRPAELDLAMQAFRAVHRGFGAGAGTFRQRLVEWLEQCGHSLTSEQVQRIATVANPAKEPGRPSRKK